MDMDTLYEAAIAGDADAIAELEMKADTLNENGETILHIESKEGKTEHVQFILREFASKNLLVKLNKNKQTALHLAASPYFFTRTSEVVKVLIDAARNLPPPSANDNPDHNLVSSFQAFIRQGDKDLNTALHLAVRYNHVGVVKLLVEADPNDRHIQNLQGKTPIYIAADERYTDIVIEICRTCTAPSMDGPNGATALHAVIQYLFPEMESVKLLIDAAKHLPSSATDNDITQDNPVTSFQAFLRQGNLRSNTVLHVAVGNFQVDVVKLLVEADPSDRHMQNDKGETPIYIAAEAGYNDIVKVICTTCTAPSLDGPAGGSTALHAAIRHLDHDIEVVKLLIGAARQLPSLASDNDNLVTSFEAFLRQGDEDLNTALHIAVMQGNLATAKLLVEADPCYTHDQNNKGETPIYIAVERGYTDIVKMICTTGTAKFYMDGPGKTTVLHAAVRNLDEAKKEVRDVIKMIIDVVKSRIIADKDSESENENENENKIKIECFEYELCKSFVEIFSATDEYRQTTLELAVERNYVEVVELILDVAYKKDCIGDEFISLMPLIYKAMDKENLYIVKLLTERYQAGAEDSIHLKKQASLISAIRRRDAESVFSLLDDHAQGLVTFADNQCWTALHHAAYHEFDSIIYTIIEAQEKSGHEFVYEDMVSTPFHVAAEKGYTSTVMLLMQLWPSSSSAYTAVDRSGQNILHLAALQSKKEMIQGILNYCTEKNKEEFVNQQDNNGNTPLHILIRRGCLVPELINYQGLDIRAKNKEGWTPFDLLYFEEQIIGDQVQIKIALETNQKMDISKSLVLPSKRRAKDVMFNESEKLMMREKQARMKDDLDVYRNSHAVAHWFADAIAGVAIARAALEMAADILNEEGETILHVESKKGDIENVRFILREFANKDLLVKPDRLKQTALHLAAQHGHTEVVKVLIDEARHLPSLANDDPDSCFHAFVRQATAQKRSTALHIAVNSGNLDIVKLLIEADPSNKHIQNDEDKTPIYMAAEKGYNALIEVICTTCTALCLDGPHGRTTALHAAILNMHKEEEEDRDVIGMMLNAAKRWSPEDSSFEALFHRTDESGRTILELAVHTNNVEVVELILVKDPAYQHDRGSKNNGFMRLIYTAIDEKQEAILKLLRETYEAKISVVHKGVIDLIVAIRRRHRVTVISLLGDNKQLVTFADEDGWTPLHHAAYHEFDSILDAIIEAQIDVGHQFVYEDKDVSTPFHVAAKEGYTFTVIRLMELWPAWSWAYTSVDNKGRNILHLAALQRKKEMIQGILKCCPEKYKNEIVNKQDNNGDTPLHLLICHGCFIPELIKFKGLDTLTKNKKDETPLDYLYLVDEIIADQVQIKIALDDIQTDQNWKFWRQNIKRKSNYLESVVLPSRREAKDVQFENAKKKLLDEKHGRMKIDLERYKKRTSTQIVVTALITTVTFTVGFTMPGGLNQSGALDQGLAVLSKKTAFNAFMVSDALALLLSTCSLFLYFLESMYEDPRQVAILNAASTGLNIVSVMAMMLTFITGTYVVLSDSLALAISVCIIGSFFFLFVIVLMIKMVYDRRVKQNED